MTKASQQQAKFITRILKHGGHRVTGRKVFGRYRSGPQEIKDNTIDSCIRREWVIREEQDGAVLWSVTTAGRDAVIEPLPVGEKTKNLVDELERQRMETTV